MKKLFLSVVIALIFGFRCFSAEFPFRTWTSTSGVQIQARLLSKSGDKLTIERSDSKQFVFPLSMLSGQDQAYVQNVLNGQHKRTTSRAVVGSVTPSRSVGTTLSLPIWSPSEMEKWWSDNKKADLDKLANELMSNLRSIWTKKEDRSMREGRDFFSWFDHWRWIELYTRFYSKKGNDSLESTFVEIGKKTSLQKVFLKALHPEDNDIQALEIFLSIARDHPQFIEKYAALAAAYAVVFDQAFPRNWPHHQVSNKDVPFDSSLPSKRFGEFVKAHLARKLEYDPSQLSVTELKFVVDHRLPISELEWVWNSVKFRRSSFGKIFASIQYDRPRLEGALFRWPYGSYSLSAIQEKGGICVDQAYFSSMAGKAKGIPTLTFVGQGSGGGHAWFGFLKNPGRWETDCGRYENQNYPVGNAIDPQRWKLITDDELGALARGEKNLSGFRGKAVDYFAWAMANPTASFFRESLQRARTLHPAYTEVWKEEASWVEKNLSDPREKRNFWDAWLKAFSNTVDLKIEGQKKLADVYDEMGNPRQAERIRSLIVKQNRSGRFDLAIKEGSEQIMNKLAKKDWAEAERSYERMVKDFEKTAGGELFYGLIRPYVEKLDQNGRTEEALDAIEFLKKRKVLDLGPGSIIGLEMQKLLQKIN
ncbi:MAG: hypothetical protein P8O23_09705 [Opitutales bacterium]|nr:hypothetical protein [Opitutales bacterium]